MTTFHAEGHYATAGGIVYALSSDGRFVTHGATKTEAKNRMDDLLTGYVKFAVKHGFDPSLGIERAPTNAERWEKELVSA